MRRQLLWACTIFCLPGCEDGNPGSTSTDYSGVVQFDSSALAIETRTDTFAVRAELADTPDKRAFGLMERTALPEDAGMLFRFETEQDATEAFYMFRTRIPLDIAFTDADGVIRAILSMEPCAIPNPRLCKTYPAGVPYWSALEMNKGYFQRHGIKVGDRVRIPE